MTLKGLSSKLLAKIYDTALDPTNWPELSQMLTEAIPEYNETKSVVAGCRLSENTPTESTLVQSILEHLDRAAQIRIKLNNEEQNLSIHTNVFEKFPFPAILLGKNGDIKHCNANAKTFLNGTHLMTVDNQQLLFSKSLQQKKYDQTIKKLIATPANNKQVNIALRNDVQSQVITIGFSVIDDLYGLGGGILLLISSNDMKEVVDIKAFSKQHQLTTAETRLLHGLLEEKSLNEISKEYELSIHTIRSQLKSIFQKTYCHRQSDLIKLVLLSQSTASKTENISLLEQHPICYHKQIIYPSNRVLSFSDIGPEKGLPVIAFPPTSGSRLQVHPDISVLFDLNIRLITVDKPGIGYSTTVENYDLQYVAEYIEALADQLSLESFALLGLCGGTAHALSASSILKERVLHTTLISSVSPYQSVDLFKGSKSSHLIELATRIPQLLYPLITLSVSNLMKESDKYYTQLFPQLCESDKQAILKSDFNDNFLLSLRECMRQGPKAFCDELALLGKDWGIDFALVTQPITFWHGKEDHYVPIHLIQFFSDKFVNAELIEVEECGHFLIYYKWFEILKDLKDKATINKRSRSFYSIG